MMDPTNYTQNPSQAVPTRAALKTLTELLVKYRIVETVNTVAHDLGSRKI